jgi:hypothetical protein
VEQLGKFRNETFTLQDRVANFDGLVLTSMGQTGSRSTSHIAWRAVEQGVLIKTWNKLGKFAVPDRGFPFQDFGRTVLTSSTWQTRSSKHGTRVLFTIVWQAAAQRAPEIPTPTTGKSIATATSPLPRSEAQFAAATS